MQFKMSLNDLTEKYCANLNVTEVLHGKDGKSAYQIALDNGFVGTEEEWLESLKGTAYDDTAIVDDIKVIKQDILLLKATTSSLEGQDVLVDERISEVAEQNVQTNERVTSLENTIGTLNDSLEEVLEGNGN